MWAVRIRRMSERRPSTVQRGVIVGALPAGVSFNESSRTLTWTIGSVAPNEPKTITVPLSHTPTVLEVGTRPALMQSQTLMGIDRFTQQKVTMTLSTLTTATGDDAGSGEVER